MTTVALLLTGPEQAREEISLFLDAAEAGRITEPRPEDAEPEESAPACLHWHTRVETFYPDETPFGTLIQVRICDECDEEVSVA